MMDLQDLRVRIDAIDRQIVHLLNERYEVVKKVGEWKRERGQPLYVPEREKALLEKLESINEGPMPDSTLRAVYREIMSGALRLESPLKVAFFGPEATFTHLAAKLKFGHAIDYIPKPGIGDVFHDVEAGRSNYGCVPVENSTEGVVNHTLDMLVDSPLKICAEINMRVEQCLLARCDKSQIRVIYSHAQSLGQCRQWLTENLPEADQVAVSSNARAAELAARAEKGEDLNEFLTRTPCGSIVGEEILARYKIVPEDATVFDVFKAFEEKKDLLAVIVTEPGVQGEKALTIVTPADFPRINRYLETYNVKPF